MRSHGRVATLAVLLGLAVAPGRAAADEGPQLTIYNQDFALVKQTRRVPLQKGTGEVRLSGVTALLEPDSVVLRDPKDPDGVRVLEQNFEGDPLSEGFLLKQHEGRMVRFESVNPATGKTEIRSGKVIRSGYVPTAAAWGLGSVPGSLVRPSGGDGGTSPIVEIDGGLQFFLPGRPIFETLGDDAILEPTLLWTLWADRAGPRDLEVSYLTGGLRWLATYNVVAPETGDRFDLVGWVTLQNQSGTAFENATVKLMAGEVSKVQPQMINALGMNRGVAEAAPPPQVTEKAFDEYHLYTLGRPTTLRDKETKQVEFCRAASVPATRLYVYDGAAFDPYRGYNTETPEYGATGNTKVATMLEFRNDKAAGLGLPLPQGTMKIYRTDSDGRREFIGENVIDHTPVDETIRIRLGNAFDLRGERRQTSYQVDRGHQSADEAFEIKVRNHKKEEVQVRVVEHLYRWSNWKIQVASDPYQPLDARTIEFRVQVPPRGEKVVTYKVHYT
ncbi:MAG TPA: DUF4139 domain-containing protein, partial [Candidatus Polarisedimenticolia bacterium]|nr:DUF4139 domain-containing protein [Candidatus Polarisedimenticolia bacterium]